MRRLHPSSVVLAVFPPGKDGEGSVKMHEGAMMTTVSKAIAQWGENQDGYGALLSIADVRQRVLGL